MKAVTTTDAPMQTSQTEEKYRVVAPEAMHETFMSDSEEEGGTSSFFYSLFEFHLRFVFFHNHMSKNDTTPPQVHN